MENTRGLPDRSYAHRLDQSLATSHPADEGTEEALRTAFRALLADTLNTAVISPQKQRAIFKAFDEYSKKVLSPRSLKPATERAPRSLVPVDPVLGQGGPPRGMLWTKDRRKGETPPEFIFRVYGAVGWLDKGMTKKQLRSRDEVLVIELYRWLRKNGNELPQYLKGKLSLVKDQYDVLLKNYAVQHGEQSPELIARDLKKLAAAAERRSHSQD